MHFHSKMAWPSATYDAISRNHSNWPSLNLPQNAREGWTNSYWKRQLKKTSEGGGGVAKTCLATNQLVASCVNTDFWLDKITPYTGSSSLATRVDETSASEQKGAMQWTGTPLRNVACFRLRSGQPCGLSTRHCRCHWIMAAWFVFLHFSLVPLCWYAVSERQMFLFFLREV